MKNINAIAFLSLGLFLGSCGPKIHSQAKKLSELPPEIKENPVILQSDSSSVATSEVFVGVVRKTALERDLSNLDEFSNNINKYVFTIKNAKAEWEGKAVQCLNQRAEDATVLEKKVVNGEVSIELDASKYLKTTYECRLVGENPFPQYKLQKGFIVDKEITMTELLGVNNGKYDVGPVIIKSSGKLFIRDSNYSLNTPLLLVMSSNEHNPEITTFKQDELTAPENSSGLSGGVLTINAQQAFGDILSVNMFGQNGGAQTLVPPTPAAPGPVGTCASITRYYPTTGKTGGISVGYPVTTYAEPSKGNDAFPGVQGFPGTNGGASGAFILRVNLEYTLKDIVFHSAGGKKGLGGKGGDPSSPGAGGDCPTGTGPSGNTASPGANGQNGIDGIIHLSSVTNLKDGQYFASNGQ